MFLNLRTGIRGSGKTSIASALCKLTHEYGYTAECIEMDDFFKTPSHLQTPQPLADREANSPDAIDWAKFLLAISERRSAINAPQYLFVEGCLCFSHEGSSHVAGDQHFFDAAVLVSVPKHVAMTRKHACCHPPVSLQDFELHFENVTCASYVKHGQLLPAGVPSFTFHNDARSSVDGLLRKLLPVVICVGDLHGWLDRTKSLFANLHAALPPLQFNTADVVFLGDYVDRGPHSNQTIEWLISDLPRLYPRQRHFFLAGNHEHALMAALGDLKPPNGGFSSWKGGEGVWNGVGSENFHWQGRRYVSHASCRGDVYNSSSTMASYGIDSGSINRVHGENAPAVLLQALQDKVPIHHRQFLKACDWVIEFPARGSWLPNLTFVHAGFTAELPLETQLLSLRAKDCRCARA